MRQLKITKQVTNRETASLDKYLQEIGRVDLITADEEVELAQRIKEGDVAALEKLTKANLRFVVSVAKQYQNQGLTLPDLINEGGITKQRWSCSDTAEYGDYVSGPRVITPEVKEHMKEVLSDIQDGTFAKRFMDDQAAGAPEFKKLRAEGEAHPIEATGREVRSMFAWRADVDKDYTEGSVSR